MLSLSHLEAARFLIAYHLTPTDLPGVFDRLGTVQYDPLNPVGRNPDLVFQARVPSYRVDDWQAAAYRDRLAYDAWDKQACLVPISDWPNRALVRARYHPWHDRQVLDEHPDAVAAAFVELDARGPLSSIEFSDRSRSDDGHSWLGPTRIKRILRALWARGEVVTHHREAGRHYYDRPERVIPSRYFSQAPLLDEDAYHRWIVLRRHQAAGLLRPKANLEIWSVCGGASQRARAIEELVEAGDLTPVRVGDRGTLYHLPTNALGLLGQPAPADRMVFLGPLDNLLWDRKAVRDIFSFEYMWEVYKREADRRWGYYVLPVLYGDRFVARFDSRLEGNVWTISRWWWEEGVNPDADMLDALRDAAGRFVAYLGADGGRVIAGADGATADALNVREPSATPTGSGRRSA